MPFSLPPKVKSRRWWEGTRNGVHAKRMILTELQLELVHEAGTLSDFEVPDRRAADSDCSKRTVELPIKRSMALLRVLDSSLLVS